MGQQETVVAMAKEIMEKQELVKQARRVERLLAKRRRVVKALRDVEAELREARRFLQALAMPSETPLNYGERGAILPGEIDGTQEGGA